MVYSSLTVLTFAMRSSVDLNRPLSFKYEFIVPFINSAFLTTLAFILDYTEIIKIDFGNSNLCRPNNFHGRLYLYVIPCGISYIFSFVFLVQCVRMMRTIENDGETEEKKNALCLILALTLFGSVSEMFGFFQAEFDGRNVDYEIITYKLVSRLVYHLVQSYGGVCLLILFCCHFRCFNKFRKSDETARSKGIAVITKNGGNFEVFPSSSIKT